jgi:translation elongation factor EF-Tu-like GTPase
MANIGLLGAVSVGKTTILRLFVKYLKTKKITEVEDGKECIVAKTDFAGEAVLDPETGIKETKTIHPNRVIFREVDTNRNHSLFAPGGDRGRAVVRMGVITISRIAKQIIAVFACDRDAKEQFQFFQDVRFFPKEINVCLNKYDLIPEAERSKVIEQMKSEIVEFFAKRKITIQNFYITCAEPLAGMEEFNDNAAEMLLRIAVESPM